MLGLCVAATTMLAAGYFNDYCLGFFFNENYLLNKDTV
jgi:hypothetical protein